MKMFLALAVFICCVAITSANTTARLLNAEGYFKIFGLPSNVSTTSSPSNEIDKAHLMAVQTEIDLVLNFVDWKLILTVYTSESLDHDNDDYVTGKLEFSVQAILAPEDDAAEYYAEIVRILNDILSDDILFGTESEQLFGVRIPAGSLTMYDEIRVTDGHTYRPSSRPILSPEKLHLLMLGDWGKGGRNGDITATATSSVVSSVVLDMGRKLAKNGGTDYTYQASVARSMMKYSRFINLSGVISLGDNFYSSGVTSTTDTLWTTIWRDVYLTEGSPLNVPWYPVLGNHDYGSASNAEAQINRYKRNDNDDDNWIMPAHNYTKKFEIAAGGSVQIIFIDTTTLAPSVNKCCNEKGGVSLAQQALLISNQLQYIESELQKAAVDQPSWLIVAGHYPVFSAGEHGDTNELKSYLLPLLQKYNVDAYMCGHDHISEHLEKQGVNYFVAGAGALTDKLGSKGSDGNLVWAGTGYSAFAAIAATEESLTVSYINIHGESVYSHTLSKKEEMAMQEDEEVEAKVEEEMDNTAWILDTLGADNNTQAAAKLSSITILCILITVTIVLVLDANFVARIKRAEAASLEESAADYTDGGEIANKDEDGDDRVVDAVRQSVGQGGVDGPRDSIPTTTPTVKGRGFLEGSLFGKHAYTHLSPSVARGNLESSSGRWTPNEDKNVCRQCSRGECGVVHSVSQSVPNFAGNCKELFAV